ncbi:hypothetical protein [Hymenobacter sp. UYP22]|uniref:hypothetical protein n=1 Tax=Hymenobacter sp. UYP22 TaxID=3156348 RepID=UPI003391D65A
MHPSPPASSPTPAALVTVLLAFVEEIGLVVQQEHIEQACFLPGLLLRQGQLVVDHHRLLYPGDILHEAGHLAVTAAAERPTVGGNITENHPEKEGEELAVLAWTYAACRHVGLPAAVVFHPDGYKNQSQWLVEQYETGHYLGLPLLVWMGLTTTADFPHMHRWLRA